MKSNESIAVVGMSGRFPQANNLQEFWKLLSDGIDTVTEIPKDRWDIDDYYDADRSAPEKTNQRHAAFVKDIHDFDPLFFNISPAEAIEMSPSQKLIMELAHEAIESTNIPFKSITGSKTGVYIGNIWNDYEHDRKHKNANITSHSALGQSANVIANRISYTYGFRGPSLVVDTGCSSSLVALHLACQSLWDNSTNLAFAGAVNHLLDPDQYIYLTKFGGLSNKGKCRAFDSEADGFVRGEGGGMIMLKRLSEAERDGDKIYAIIRGSAMNNNGFNVNLPATSVNGQIEALEEAYKMAGIKPEDVHYVEAHGTGTKLGDPTEARALGEFFGQKKESGSLHIGSVKTNIGHLEGAAGMAGLLKVILAMNQRKLPKTLHFNNPNPNIDFEGLRLKVQENLEDWPSSNTETFKAGVNSFGWGGTNAHVVLEEYRAIDFTSLSKETKERKHYLPVSARSEQAMREYIARYRNHLSQNINGKLNYFYDTCISAAVSKPNFEYRTIFSGVNKQEMISQMEDFLKSDERISPIKESKGAKTVFVFPGQGSQWIGMGKELYQQHEVFKNAMDRCDRVFHQYTSWSLLDKLYAHENGLESINTIQPAICAIQISLAALWQSWGIEPDAVVGHSMGEVAAAYVSGSISLHDAAKIICTRSQLMKTVSGKGAMGVTDLTLDQAKETIKKYPKLSIAVSNSPKSTVLAGDETSLLELIDILDSQGRFARKIKVDVASHSNQMDPLKADLHKALESVWPMDEKIAIYSTVKGQKLSGRSLDADYWVENLRHGVQFSAVMKQLVEQGHGIFIEVSPHAVLTNAMTECLDAFGAKNPIIGHSLLKEKPEMLQMESNLKELFLHGKDIDWARFYNVNKVPAVSLPGYPFQKDTYQIESRKATSKIKEGVKTHPFLGEKLALGGLENATYWETTINLQDFGYLKEYKANNLSIIPSSFYIELMLSAIKAFRKDEDLNLNRVEFKKALPSQKDDHLRIQIKVSTDKLRNAKVECFYFMNDSKSDQSWILLATATHVYGSTNDKKNIIIPNANNIEWEHTYNKEDVYKSIGAMGMDYGESYRGITELKTHHRLIWAELNLEAVADIHDDRFIVNPLLLTTCFQTLLAKQFKSKKQLRVQTAFLSQIGSYQVFKEFTPEDELWLMSELSPFECKGPAGSITTTGNILVFDKDNQPVLSFERVTATIVLSKESEENKHQHRPSYYHIDWKETGRKSNTTSHNFEDTPSNWLILSDNEEVASYLKLELSSNGKNVITAKEGPFFEKVSGNGQPLTFEFDMRDDDQYMELISTIKNDHNLTIDGVIFTSLNNQKVDRIGFEKSDVPDMGSTRLLNLLKGLESQQQQAVKLIIITQNVQSVDNSERLLNLNDATLQGFSRVIQNEHTGYDVKTIDLPGSFEDDDLKLAVEEIGASNQEREVSIRNRKVKYARLDSYIPTVIDVNKSSFSEDGYYLVTGFNDISFAFTRWMLAHGARNFLLLQNYNSPSSFMSKVEDLVQLGAQLSIKKVDLSDYQALRTVVSNIENEIQLKGIIHDVGYIPTGSLVDLELNDLESTLNSEIMSAWNLHQLSLEIPVEDFILLSSISSITGPANYGNYVASSTFLDQIAHYRRQLELPAICINWGGVSKRSIFRESLSSMPGYPEIENITCVKNTIALNAFARINHHDVPQLGIFNLNIEELIKRQPELVENSLFSDIMASQESTKEEMTDITTIFQLLPTNEDKLEAIENYLIKSVAKIIKADKSKITNNMTFKGLGVDSLMAVRLRNQLSEQLCLEISIADFWENPTIGEYAIFIFNKLSATNELSDGTKSDSPFEIVNPNPDATCRLICFHDAGGNSSLYQNWSGLPDSTELVLVELPGRGKRSGAKPYTMTEDFVDDIMPSMLTILDKPFAFFGHSMGGSLAYVVTQELKKLGQPMPQLLVMSSMPELGGYNKEALSHDMSDEALTNEFPHLSVDNIPDDELRKMLIDLLRVDLRLLNDYEYEESDPMDIPIVAIHGLEDGRVSSEDMLQWEKHTTRRFQIIERPGGHHYLYDDTDFLMLLLQKELMEISSEGQLAKMKR
ncbi:MAG: alpha/beta fold hydrolase [Bacteroidota bacterium]